MFRNPFRMTIRPGHLTVDPSSAEMHAELDRREWAFESAVAEMSRPRMTTEAILDVYLAQVTR